MANKKIITSLTKEQEAAMPRVRDKWLAIGLCTDPADRPRAENGMRMAYDAAKLKPPTRIYWEPSPFAGARRAAMLMNDTQTPTQEQIRAQLYTVCYGFQDAGRLSYYDFFRTECGLVEETEPLMGLMEIAQSCGWWWPFDEAVVMTERPIRISRDSDLRLHNETQAAVEYLDGGGVYAIAGVRVPKRIVLEPESVTHKEIDAEQNAEVRRIMIRRYGEARYLIDSGAKEIQSDRYGILYRKELRNDEPLQMVRVLNSTPESDGSIKPYFLRVPADVTTAHEGVAWTFRKTVKTYNPLVET